MKEPRYFLDCTVAIVAGCPLGALWLARATGNGRHDPLVALPVTIFDSFLVGWFPALLYGALLHYSMQRLG
jgi:hypothetical protein